MYAQNNPDNLQPFFDHITTLNGLSGDHVNCLFRDHSGFLWIGTQNGLNEYDGKNMVVYRHIRFDSSSIVDDDVLSITEDDSGYLWLGTNNGISRFNPFNHQSINYVHDPSHPYTLNENFKCYVYIDKQKTIWIGNQAGVSYFNQKKNQFISLQILNAPLNAPPFSATSSFLEDQQGRFWIGTFSGLVLYDRKKQTAQHFIFKEELKPQGFNAITSLFCDHAGRIWVGTWGNGICEFNPSTQTFQSYKWNTNSLFEGIANIVTAITETKSNDGQYSLWVGSTEGLMKIDSLPVSDKSVEKILPDNSNLHSINDKNISCLLADANKILWVGTSHGINQFTARNQAFSHIIPFNGNPTKIISDSINHHVNYFISAWYGIGLTQFNDKFKMLRSWEKIPPGATSPNNRQVSSFFRSKDGTFWIATFNGLYHYDMKNDQITAYLHHAADNNSIASDKLTAVAEDATGNIWIGTYGKGLDRYDPQKNVFTHFVHKASDSTSLVDNLVWSINADRQKNIWITTNEGLSVYDRNHENFSNFYDDQADSNTLQGKDINGILEGDNGDYWIISNKGLNYLDWSKKHFILYGTEEGLKDNNILSFTKDKDGILWLCTADGISSFNPATKTFINYGEQNGVPKNINGPMITLENGKILTGGDHFILQFDPASLKVSTPAPQVYITQMLVAGKQLAFQKPVSESGTIILNYPENSFSCSFTAPDFFNGAAVKYAYRLAGVDADWVQAGNRNFLSYSNLAAGKYVLYIKAANSDGVWNEKGISLHVEVLPPFWQTNWFRIIALLFIVLCIYLLFYFRLSAIQKREALKTAINKQMADMRLKVLRTRINPHFMFNALNSIQECIYTQKTDTASRYLSKFSMLLRLILENSENTFITISEEIEILKLYLELESLRFDEHFSYAINAGNIESDLLEIPPMLIQPFVENALWHGLRYKSGEKKLLISFNENEEYINVVIEDNGIGRQAAKAFAPSNEFKKQSWGIKISEEQLKMMETLSKLKTEMKIEDLLSANSEPAGTKVILSIPIVEVKN